MEKKAKKILLQLRPAIGMSVKYQGESCKLIELLEDELAIVLESCHKNTRIQPDQMGEAHRRVPQTKTIPVLVGEKKEINPELITLNLPLEI